MHCDAMSLSSSGLAWAGEDRRLRVDVNKNSIILTASRSRSTSSIAAINGSAGGATGHAQIRTTTTTDTLPMRGLARSDTVASGPAMGVQQPSQRSRANLERRKDMNKTVVLIEDCTAGSAMRILLTQKGPRTRVHAGIDGSIVTFVTRRFRGMTLNHTAQMVVQSGNSHGGALMIKPPARNATKCSQVRLSWVHSLVSMRRPTRTRSGHRNKVINVVTAIVLNISDAVSTGALFLHYFHFTC